MYKIVFAKSAQKEFVYLYRANRPIFEKIRRSLRGIAEDPRQGKPLKMALKGKWSYRVGVYRIIYSIQREVLTVYILDICHRREAYR